MQEESVFYDIQKGDIDALVGYSTDSAMVLQKYGAHGFDDVCWEVIYFTEAVEYHEVMLKRWYETVIEVDKETARRAEIRGHGWFAQGPRQDVLATVFEFDSILVCTRSMFDRIVRTLQTPLSQQLPLSITNFLNRRKDLLDHPLCKEVVKAWEEWGQQTTSYRDCLLHFWTLHDGISGLFSSTKERELLLPDNPEVKSRARFSYNKKIRIIDYSSEIKRKSKLLAESVFRKIFEFLVVEEFGCRVHYSYWDDIPQVPSQQIKGNHEILLPPGIAEDAKGRITRFSRKFIIQNGKTRVNEKLPPGWCERAEYPIEMSSQISSLSTEISFALKKIAEQERTNKSSGE